MCHNNLNYVVILLLFLDIFYFTPSITTDKIIVLSYLNFLLRQKKFSSNEIKFLALFCNAPLSDNDTPYFLNIRRPVVIDVENVAPIVIPNDLPSECDGIIFLNYGAKKLTAFYVKDIESQSMRF